MRPKHIAFVQCNWDRVDVMVSIPKNVDACLVLISHGLVRVRCLLAHNIFLVLHASRQGHVSALNVDNAQETGVSALRPRQILNFQFYLFRHFIGQQDRFFVGIRFVMRTRLVLWWKIDKIEMC